MKKEELKNYVPKGQLEGFPKEVIARMLDCQEEQGNKRNISVFENLIRASAYFNGFSWNRTKEGWDFWNEVIRKKNFDIFFGKYPKEDNQEKNQKFKVGDKVIDIITRGRGEVISIDTLNKYNFPIYVYFNTKEKESFTLDGRFCNDDKQPRLLHYRDDYDYDVIDFNNLPKRQEPKRWRAKKNGVYNYVGFDNKDGFYSDDPKDYYTPFDDNNYNSGNYFSTEVEAEIIAQKMNTYFKQLIQEEHEHERN